MKCKFCGAEVKLGERCQYCGSVAEPFYYSVNSEEKKTEQPEEIDMDQIQREKIAAKPKKIKAVWEPPELEEMPVVILSLHQKWWQKMAAGEKVLELRKTKPQCKAPFRVLVYVTGGVGIVGEFICPEVLEIKNFEEAEEKSKVPAHDIHNYAAGSRNKVYGWEITAVKEYPRTVTLEELGMKRAPQSWQYMR